MIGISCTEFCSKDFVGTWKEVSNDFSHWEIFSDGTHAVQKICGEFMANVNEFEMSYSLHSSIADTNVAAINERMREATFMEFYSEIENCQIMGIDLITIHPGLCNLTCSALRERSIECARLTMKSLDRVSQEYGVKIAIENMPNLSFMLGQTATDLFHIVEDTELGICFDIGHANTMGQIQEMVELFDRRIINVHIHDNMGDKDSHLTIGEGNIDFQKVVHLLRNYAGNYIIEAKSIESAVKSKKVLEGLLS
ncbi:MAG: sugar phosphate isomerase/epimerase [Candidatus Methanogranum gryphiswaldense]|nr:MAG: sugar phosphate isomerase/epimerase [Candidatus Methanogranum sp. U3.2.1]